MSLYEFFFDKLDNVSRACSRAVDFAKDNPVKCAGVVAATVVTGGAAAALAPALVATAGLAVATTTSTTMATTAVTAATVATTTKIVEGIIEHGRMKNGGGHDHRTNTGKDRTPAQRSGDAKRRKDA